MLQTTLVFLNGCIRHRFGFLNLPVTKYGKDYFKRSCKDWYYCQKLLSHLGISSHGDWSTKLFGVFKHCSDSQCVLTCCYFKRCFTQVNWQQNEKDIIFLIYSHLILTLPTAVCNAPERTSVTPRYTWGEL